MLALKKTASKISRDVRKFWLKINRVLAFKQKTESDEIREKVSKGPVDLIDLTFTVPSIK